MSNHLTTTITTTFGLSRLIIPSSFVAKTSGITLEASQGTVTLAEFTLGRGGWIIQARAIAESVGGTQPFNVYWSLSANPGPVYGDDTAEVSAVLIPTIVFMIGVQVSTTAVVDLTAKNSAPGSARIRNIVITGIKQDEVISLAM